MDEVLAFLKKNPTYYLTTINGDKPEVRPFGTICKYEGKLYIQTGKKKDCYKQMIANPHVAICGFDAEAGSWLRLSATVEPDESIAACDAMLDEYEHLRQMYTPGDGNTVVLSLNDVTAQFCSFTAEPRTVQF